MAKTKVRRQEQLVKKTDAHWTERSVDDFISRITFDFVTQIDDELERSNATHGELDKKLKVSKGRVSQVLNNPANIGLKNIVRYARAVDQKVALVLYNDGDPSNARGPVNSSIFSQCWERAGRPTDAFQLNSTTCAVSVTFTACLIQGAFDQVALPNWLRATSEWSSGIAQGSTVGFYTLEAVTIAATLTGSTIMTV